MTCSNKRWVGLLAIFFGCFSIASYAEIPEINLTNPKLRLRAGGLGTDNINPTLQHEIEATGYFLAADGRLVTKGEGHITGLDYFIQTDGLKLDETLAQLDDSQQFTTIRSRLFSRLYLRKDWLVDVHAAYTRNDQKFGTGISSYRTGVFESDTRTVMEGAVKAVYGNDVSDRYIAFTVGHRDEDYANNNEYSNRYDRKESFAELDIMFGSAVSGLGLKLQAAQDDYVDPTRADYNAYYALVGGEWEPTGKSKLQAFIGQYFRDVEGEPNDSELAWQFDFLTRPQENLLLKLTSTRSTRASKVLEASTSQVESVIGSMTYTYSERWSYGFNVDYARTSFSEPSDIPDLTELNIKLDATMSFGQQHQVIFSFGVLDAETEDKDIDYKQNEVRLGWQYVY